MTEAAFAYAPPPDVAGTPLAAALRALPLAKQAEILWRIAVAADTEDDRQLRTLLRALRAVADPTTVPRCDDATARTVPAERFLD